MSDGKGPDEWTALLDRRRQPAVFLLPIVNVRCAKASCWLRDDYVADVRHQRWP
jgi:hypothetical protein